MGWERRGNGYYYYRKRREGHRVISEYVGNGRAAEVAAAMDRLKRRERKTKRTGRQPQIMGDSLMETLPSELHTAIDAS